MIAADAIELSSLETRDEGFELFDWRKASGLEPQPLDPGLPPKAQFLEAGLVSRIIPFQALMSYPVASSLSMVDGSNYFRG